ncbi:MAG: dimethylsulfoniopropionate demethylase, partial [Proteobacteria bacterium]|nr:dimethylsulfoniopropionate demethylase [Pseudomonadota bacterium]
DSGLGIPPEVVMLAIKSVREHYTPQGVGRTASEAEQQKHPGSFTYGKGGGRGRDTLFEAGADLDVRAGCPNLIERIEGGLLSYGNDITLDHTPFEVGLGKYCNMDTATGCLGHGALLGKQNPSRQIRPVEIDGDPLSVAPQLWPLKNQSGESAGYISSAVWSPDFHTNVAIGMVNKDDWEPGTRLVVDTPEGTREARVRDEFWN